MRLAAALLLVVVSADAQAQAQARVDVTDRGHGASGRIIEAALAQSHRLVAPAPEPFLLRRGEQARTTLIVLGRSTTIQGNVQGDVVVVDGDLFVGPGARIAGRAVAIGGGVYPSSLAIVEKGSESFRDNTFTITAVPGGYALAYRSLRQDAAKPLLFPYVYGFRMPTYDRVNGLSLPFGPALTFASGRGELNVLATYRSDLGTVDPSAEADVQFTRRLRSHASAGRATLSNDAWIWSDLVNSASVLVFGVDTRNHFRADRAELTVHRLWEGTQTRLEPFIGGRTERAWSVGPSAGERRGPWSLLERSDTLDGMWRPNPTVQAGQLSSLLVGGTVGWESEDDLRISARTTAELAGSAPADQKFAQVTSDVGVSFPTFREQEYELDVHWVTTLGDLPPSQRFAYLGGSGTLPFTGLLAQGGDELLLVDQRYAIPLLNVTVGMFGNPTLLLRHRLASAGVGRLPHFEQIVGVGVMILWLRGEVQVDATTGKARFSTGFSFSR